MNNTGFFVILIAGPTAVGKTNIAIAIAQKLNAEIINADSRQLYKEISIGTAKPTEKQLAAVPHYFVNTHSVAETFTAGDFEKQALAIIDQQKLAGKKAIVVAGGTGMYINALLNGLDDLPDGDETIRAELQQNFLHFGVAFLQNKLKELDEVAYQKIANTNPQRMMRAIEVCLVSGQKYSDFLNKEKSKRPFTAIKIALNLEREILYAQINNRVDEMVESGLENEVRTMQQFKNCYALKTVGYTEMFDYIDSLTTKEKAIELIKQHTRNYAKRQITWFKKDVQYKWFSPLNVSEIENYVSAEIAKNKI